MLRFWEKYGLAPTLEAFKIKRRTVYHWRAQLKTGGEDLEALNEKSKAPRRRRKRRWPKEIHEEIRRLRTAHPNLSKEKLYPFVKLSSAQRKLSCPKARTIGRIIADAPDKMRVGRSNCGQTVKESRRKRPQGGRKSKGYKASAPGHSVGPLTRWSTF